MATPKEMKWKRHKLVSIQSLDVTFHRQTMYARSLILLWFFGRFSHISHMHRENQEIQRQKKKSWYEKQFQMPFKVQMGLFKATTQTHITWLGKQTKTRIHQTSEQLYYFSDNNSSLEVSEARNIFVFRFHYKIGVKLWWKMDAEKWENDKSCKAKNNALPLPHQKGRGTGFRFCSIWIAPRKSQWNPMQLAAIVSDTFYLRAMSLLLFYIPFIRPFCLKFAWCKDSYR